MLMNVAQRPLHHAVEASPPVSHGTPRVGLDDLMGLLRRRRHSIATGLAVALAVAALFLAFAPSRYSATALVMPDTRRSPASPGEASPVGIVDPVLLQSQLEVMKSDRIANIVIDKLGLLDDSEFVGPGMLWRWLAAAGLVDATPPTEEMKRQAAVAHFTHNLTFTRVSQSYVAQVSYTALDPQKAAAIVNEATNAYLEDQLGARFFSLQQAANGIQQRIGEARRQAEAAARAAEEFRSSNGLTKSGGRITTDTGSNPPPDLIAKAEELDNATQSLKSQYEGLVTRYNRITQFVQQSLPVSEARILMPASPPLSRSSPRYALTLLLAVFAGGVLGVGAAAGREYFDRSIRDPEQVERETGVRCIGVLSRCDQGIDIHATRKGSAARRKLPGAHPRPNEIADVEVLKAVKLAIDRRACGAQGCLVGIVSPRTGSEAASLASSLAALAIVGDQSVLLICQSQIMGDQCVGAANERGRDTSTVGAKAGGVLLRHSSGFDLLGGSSDVLRPSDFFGSDRGRKLIKSMQKAYDYIIIVLPPVLESIDAAASAEFVDVMVLVANTRSTSVDDLARAIHLSEPIAERLVGAVIVQRGAAPMIHSL